jgi:predicted RNase H-like nuclease (RuvC/YqgF family)
MGLETVLALAGLVVTLGTVLWRLSSTLTELRQERKQMHDEIGNMKEAIFGLRNAIEKVNAIPLHEQRIAQLETLLKAQQDQISTLWRKVFSIDRHVAVQRAVSGHDIRVEDDTDPPPKG